MFKKPFYLLSLSLLFTSACGTLNTERDKRFIPINTKEDVQRIIKEEPFEAAPTTRNPIPRNEIQAPLLAFGRCALNPRCPKRLQVEALVAGRIFHRFLQDMAAQPKTLNDSALEQITENTMKTTEAWINRAAREIPLDIDPTCPCPPYYIP